MKAKPHKQFEKFARKVVDEYLKKLLLDRHTVDIEPKNKTNYMECQFRGPYLDTVIRYNPDVIARDWSEKKFDDLKHGLIHELCHIITDPFYNHANKRFVDKDTLEEARETLTDHIAMIVCKNDL